MVYWKFRNTLQSLCRFGWDYWFVPHLNLKSVKSNKTLRDWPFKISTCICFTMSRYLLDRHGIYYASNPLFLLILTSTYLNRFYDKQTRFTKKIKQMTILSWTNTGLQENKVTKGCQYFLCWCIRVAKIQVKWWK